MKKIFFLFVLLFVLFDFSVGFGCSPPDFGNLKTSKCTHQCPNGNMLEETIPSEAQIL